MHLGSPVTGLLHHFVLSVGQQCLLVQTGLYSGQQSLPSESSVDSSALGQILSCGQIGKLSHFSVTPFK